MLIIAAIITFASTFFKFFDFFEIFFSDFGLIKGNNPSLTVGAPNNYLSLTVEALVDEVYTIRWIWEQRNKCKQAVYFRYF